MMKRLKYFLITALLLCLSLVFVACNKIMLDTPIGLNMSESYILYWSNVTDARDYALQVKNIDNGQTNEISSSNRNTYYNFAYLDPGQYEIRVMAIGGRSNDIVSNWSDPVPFDRPYESGLVLEPINGNTEYMVTGIGTAAGDVVIEDYYKGKPVTAIGPKAFVGKGSSKIESVVLGPNIYYIGDNAFQNCSKLTSVTLPDSITYMGVSVFQGCHKLETVNIPKGINIIPESTFNNCYALKDIEIGDNILMISEKAFASCRGLEKLDLTNVMYIGANAFSGATAIESVTLGKDLETIGNYAFSGCTALRSVMFDNAKDGFLYEYGLTIGNYAFQSCAALERIDLPEGVTEVGAYAFYRCAALDSVTIPDTVTAVGEFAFHATSLYDRQIEVREGDKDSGYVYADKWLVAVNNDIKLKLQTIDQNTFKSDTVGIAANTFLTSVIVNGAATTKGCPALESIILGDSIKYIGQYAFYTCDILNTITVSQNGQLEVVGDRAFQGCGRLNNVQFNGSKLRVIGSYAFYNCATLNNRNNGRLAPDTLERIGTYAFNGTALWTYAGNSGEDTADESNIGTNGIAYADNWVVGYNNIIEGVVTLKEGIIGIADYAFYNCQQLQSISGLGGVERLGRGAFYNCAVLGSVFIGDNVTEIKENTFYGCSALSNISLPLSLRSIGRNAFYGCTMLETIDMSATRVTTIESSAFYGCTNVTKILFPGQDIEDGNFTLTTIGDYAFFGLENAETLIIPDGVLSIGERAFSNWKKLVNLDLGETVLEIGDMAFMNCELLEKVELPDSVLIVGNYGFYNCPSLVEVDLGNGIRQIGVYAFAISSLQHIVLPESVEYIGQYAFKNCWSLTTVIFKGMPSIIGAHAFYGDSVLTIYMTSTEPDPEDWNLRWNSSHRPVVRGVELSADGDYLVAFTASPELITNPFAYGGFFAPTRKGYDFVGWATEPDGNPVYSADEWRKAEIGTKLYAVWQESAPEEETPPSADVPPYEATPPSVDVPSEDNLEELIRKYFDLIKGNSEDDFPPEDYDRPYADCGR